MSLLQRKDSKCYVFTDIMFFLSVALFEELLILIVEVDDVVDVEVTVEQ